jgi:murein DD-endopeptidase MepM/ murein hydrolase activator NlpD
LLNSCRDLPTICHNPRNSDDYSIFVIQDYKLRTQPARARRPGTIRAIAALVVVAATVGAVRFVDLDALPSLASAHAASDQPVSQPLILPQSGNRATSPGATSTVGDGRVTPALQKADPAPVTTALLSDTFAEERKSQPEAATEAPAQSLPPAQILPKDSAPAQEASEDAAAPSADALAETVIEIEPVWKEHLISRGDSLARIFAQQGLAPALLNRIVNSSPEAKRLARIRPGQKLRFQFDENDELIKLELQRNRVESLRVAIADDQISTQEISKTWDARISSAAGVIESSLFVDGQKAGLSDGQIMELATIFGWDIDFALEIRAGDLFRVLYEDHYLNGERLRDGPILAAEFTNRGTTYRAVRYEDTNGEIGYYDVDGHSKRRAFIRSPIKFARVSSRYNPRRWHPVLKKWRSHKGVDYAAPTGTPIRATGDGRVVFRGTKGGYGRTVILEHGGKYTTLYAHLSKFSKRAKSGNRVKQGQVIGYVGKTGLASGPHLHYEFRVNGQHRDPLRVKLPKSMSLPKAEIAGFRKATAPLLAQLEQIPTDTMVASAGPGSTRTP